MRQLILPLVLRSGVTRSATLPWSVNFTALSIRFSSAARSRTGSPTANAGSFSEISTDDFRPFAAARPVRESPALRASVRRSKKSCRTWRPGPPLRAASTNSVARLARCSAPALMVSTQRRSRSSRSEVASRLLIARMPVSGVRTSCAKAANAVSTMPGTGGGGFTLAARLHSGAGYALFRSPLFFWPCDAPGAHFCRHDPPSLRGQHGTPPRAKSRRRFQQPSVELRKLLRHTDEPPDIGRCGALPPQFAQGGGIGRFRELLS